MRQVFTKVDNFGIVMVALFVLTALAGPVLAQGPVMWDPNDGGNGNKYQAVVVPEGLTWKDAEARAQAAGGHLVTITSQEENTFVFGLIAENPAIWINVDFKVAGDDGEDFPVQLSAGPYIGFFQTSAAREPGGGWTWVTGEMANYSNWANTKYGLEPNNFMGVEHIAHFMAAGLNSRAHTWNDQPNKSSSDFLDAGLNITAGAIPNPRGYIVEFEAQRKPQ